jgi:alkylated DNA repair dioxygenase AlkB
MESNMENKKSFIEKLLHFQPNFISKLQCEKLKQYFMSLPFKTTQLNGKDIKRKKLFWCLKDEKKLIPLYRYTGDQLETPTDFPDELKDIVAQVRKFAQNMGQDINHCVAIEYQNEKDSITPHYDKYDDFVLNNGVFCISFGKTRPILLQNMNNGKKETLDLPEGSLYYISWNVNQNYVHSIPAMHYRMSTRWSLTFRNIKSKLLTDGKVIDSTGKIYPCVTDFKNSINPLNRKFFKTPQAYFNWNKLYNPFKIYNTNTKTKSINTNRKRPRED